MQSIKQLPHELEPIRTDIFHVLYYSVLLLPVAFLEGKQYLSEELVMLP